VSEPRKIVNPGASAIVSDLGSTAALVAMQSAGVRAGSRSRADAHGGSPGTWEALPISTVKHTGGGRSINTQARGRCAPRPQGAKPGAPLWYRRARATELCGMDGSGQSTPTVPVKQGNPPQGSLRREEGCREATAGPVPGGTMNRGGDRCPADRGR
jgi:hypothetical protein